MILRGCVKKGSWHNLKNLSYNLSGELDENDRISVRMVGFWAGI
jgi:hypothetical protein